MELKASWANPVARIILTKESGEEIIVGTQYRWNTGELQNRVETTEHPANSTISFRPIKPFEIGKAV